MSEREILFRGKRVDNGEWIEGDLIHRQVWRSYLAIIRVRDDGFDNYTEYEVEPSTVGQYTGLTDKNGKKIFEGDIVKVADECIDYAIWANGCFCMARQMMFYEFTYQDSSRMEVIGNVHDNLELLKGE